VVEDDGVAYFTSAGNFGRNSYAADFRPIDATSIADLPAELTSVPGLVLHDFDPGPGVDVFQLVTIPEGTSSLTLRLQWDQPWGASQSDVDLFVYAADGVTLLERLEGTHQLNGNPELAASLDVVPGVEQVQVVIAHAGGVSPTFVKYLTYHTDLQVEYATASSTIVGHANSATAAAVGASFYFRTPAYRESPALLAPSSSWGGTPILFAEDGTRQGRSRGEKLGGQYHGQPGILHAYFNGQRATMPFAVSHQPGQVVATGKARRVVQDHGK